MKVDEWKSLIQLIVCYIRSL